MSRDCRLFIALGKAQISTYLWFGLGRSYYLHLVSDNCKTRFFSFLFLNYYYLVYFCCLILLRVHVNVSYSEFQCRWVNMQRGISLWL